MGDTGANGKPTVEALAEAFVVASGKRDGNAIAALMPTDDQLSTWVSCEGTHRAVRKFSEMRDWLRADYGTSPRDEAWELIGVRPQNGDAPDERAKGSDYGDGCTLTIDLTTSGDLDVEMRHGSATSTCELTAWNVGGRWYLADFDC